MYSSSVIVIDYFEMFIYTITTILGYDYIRTAVTYAVSVISYRQHTGEPIPLPSLLPLASLF